MKMSIQFTVCIVVQVNSVPSQVSFWLGLTEIGSGRRCAVALNARLAICMHLPLASRMGGSTME